MLIVKEQNLNWGVRALKILIHFLTRICLWIRALSADWLTVTSILCSSHTCPQHRIQNKTIVTSQLVCCFTIYKTIFYSKCWWSPNRQKSLYRHAKHKPSADFSRNDSYVISKGSVYICRSRCILKKSLLTAFTYSINK